MRNLSAPPPVGTHLPVRDVPGLHRPIPAIGAGCWTIGGPATNQGIPIGWDDVDPGSALAGLFQAHQLGIRLYDTADVYGMGRSEQLVGELVADVPRGELVLSSKVGYHPGPDGEHPYQPDQIRRQLDRTLTHLNTDHLDLYFLHSGDFGPDDQHLQPALDTLHQLRDQGMISAIGLRAPHEFASEWADREHPLARQARRFLHLFHTVQPAVIAVRHNLLSHQYGPDETDVFTLARHHGTGVLIKQSLGQGLLLGAHDPDHPRRFSEEDHRSRDPMFTPAIVRTIHDGISLARHAISEVPDLLTRAALGYALRQPEPAILVGFRDATQIAGIVRAVNRPLDQADTDLVHRALAPARTLMYRHLTRPPVGQKAGSCEVRRD
jgi:aryl-alcohol dehydrogenase-like predicted oxidoreductase